MLSAAAILDVAVAIGTDGASAIEVAAARKAAQLAINKAAGRAFETSAVEALASAGKETAEQITLRTASGKTVRADIVARDPATGEIEVIEAKSSQTAPLTPNQRQRYPEIETGGATIVGEGKPGFEGGLRIPPKRVLIFRPERGPR